VAFSPSRLAGTLFVTGLLGIGYEVLAVRVASQVLENTVYSFACVLAVYLLGTAAGAALYQRFAPRQRFRETLANLLAATSILCLSGVFVLWHAEPVYHLVRDAVGGDMLGSLVGELTLSTAVLLLPTAAMGSTFSHLAQEATHNGLGLGRALAVNTLGCALAPASFGIVLLPELGSVIALVLTALAYITLAPYSDRMSWLRALAPAGLAATALFVLSPQQLVALFPGEKILEHSEGVMAAVTVVEDEQNQRHLRVNSRFQMGGTATAYSDQREAHIPLLLHPDPRTALFLGTGTGITFATAAHYPNLRAEGVELIPEIVALMRYFQSQSGYSRALDRLQVSVADARRYVQASPRTYDVIVADLFHPARDGAGSLYTVEHFRAIRERLAPEGLFVQWLPLYQLDLNTLRTIIRTYLKVFPDAHAVLAHYSLKAPIVGLIGGNRSLSYPYGWLAQRAHDSALAQELASLRLGNDFELFGCFLADARTLHQFAGEGPLNTDDYPVVIFAAPRFAYANPEPAEARFLALIDAFPPRPELVLEAPSNEDTLSMHRRMKAYFRARNRFLHTGVGKTENPDIQQLVRELREPLLAVVRTSTDFAAAYNPLLAMAYQLHRIDPASSKRLLQDLEKANPLRSDARELRQRLFLD
jgi:spermidine synthase